MSTSLENAVRAERATEWFDQADKHVLVAKRIPHKRELKPQVIFHLGQAMEMLVKGLAAASGYSHSSLKSDFGHNYVDLYVSLLEETLGQSGIASQINQVLSVFYTEGNAYDASIHLSNVRNHLVSPGSTKAKLTEVDWRSIYLSAFRMGVDEVDQLIRLYDEVGRNQALNAGGFALLREQMALEQEISVDSVPSSAVHKELRERTRFLKPFLGLLIFACIFWPHNMPARYPAPPGSDLDVFQVRQFGSLGVQHYSDALGVVKRLKILQECCEEVVKDLIRGQRNGRLFMTRKDVRPDL